MIFALDQASRRRTRWRTRARTARRNSGHSRVASAIAAGRIALSGSMASAETFARHTCTY